MRFSLALISCLLSCSIASAASSSTTSTTSTTSTSPNRLPYDQPRPATSPKHPQASISDIIWKLRRDAVVDAFKHAWAGYSRDAWGFDVYHPLSKAGSNIAGDEGCGFTIVDALDTMLVMGLTDEFEKARDWVTNELSFNHKSPQAVSTFEVTIRVLGGLLSAHYLTQNDGDKRNSVFLKKAIELGDRLAVAYGTSTGLPMPSFILSNKQSKINIQVGTDGQQQQQQSPLQVDGGVIGTVSDVVQTLPAAALLHKRSRLEKRAGSGWTSLAGVGTLQLEMRYLSYASGNPKYARLADHTYNAIGAMRTFDGLRPASIDAVSGQYAEPQLYTVGALCDSYYEYQLKQWIQSGKREQRFRDDFVASAAAIRRHLVSKTPRNGNVYLNNLFVSGNTGKPGARPTQQTDPVMGHLACFYAGSLVLSATSNASGSGQAQADMDLADKLAETCVQGVLATASHLAPEDWRFVTTSDIPNLAKLVRSGDKGTDIKNDFIIPRNARYNLLRPETMESLVYLWRATGNVKYREYGWQIFEAINKYSRLSGGGYVSFDDVTVVPPVKQDVLESFFFAELLKYTYLLFSDDTVLPFDKVVFNTEAHPFPIL